MDEVMEELPSQKQSLIDKVIRFCLENKLVVGLLVIMFLGWGLMAAPFDWDLWGLPRSPVPVDAIPDIGENQQIVFTEWMGRSPQDVEDQITYPLTVSLLGIPGVKTIRSYSFFGFSSIYIIFEDDVDFYWSRSRVLEKLNCRPHWALMRRAWGRYSGTPLRAGTKKVIRRGDGTWTSFALYRIGRSVMPCSLLRA
jgi:Cu(I)/Ag(I) efflux system membrane protein CusA/SilA